MISINLPISDAKRIPDLENRVSVLQKKFDDQQQRMDDVALRGAQAGSESVFKKPFQLEANTESSEFVTRASVSITNRGPYEQNFKTAFSALQQPKSPPAQDNPSNAKTVMQDGKAVYNDDNYTITANDDNEVRIFNKKTNETYKAWGDPHMDVDGKRAFDFYGKTSFKLTGGPKVTLDTIDAGNQTTYSSKLTITNGGYGAQIIGIDGKTKGDLAVKEYRNQGRELDRQVDDGVVLEENQDMTVNDGRGFVVTDPNGLKKQVDQSYIDSVDLKKTKGLSSQNVNQFDTISNRSFEPGNSPRQYGTQKQSVYGGEYDATSPVDASYPRYERPASYSTDQRNALHGLMDWCKPAWSDGFKSREPSRIERERQRERDDAESPPPQRANNRIKVKIDVPDWMNAKLDVAVTNRSGEFSDIRLQVWG